MWCLSLATALASEPDRSLSDELSAEIAALEDALSQREDETVRLRLAGARIEALQPEAALELLQPLLEEDRAHLEARQLRARAFLDLGDPGRGLTEVELLRHLRPGHVPQADEVALTTLLERADGVARGLPDEGEHAALRLCLEELGAGEALQAWEGCLDAPLVEDLVRDMSEDKRVWAAEEASRSLAEQLFRNAWMEPRASRLIRHEDGRVELWLWTEVRVERGLFDHLVEGGLCAESCSQLGLGGAWRRLDASGREEVLEANRDRSLWQLQGFALNLGVDGQVLDVVLLSGEPAAENLSHVLAEPTWRAQLLGLEPPVEQQDLPDPNTLEQHGEGSGEADDPGRALLFRVLTVLAALALVGLSVWIWRGGSEDEEA